MCPRDYTFDPDLARASTIPARWYTDPAMLPLERARIFHRTWQAAAAPAADQGSALTSALARPGSYLACDIAGEPVVVTRDKHGRLRAMSNVCRHRGALVAEGRGQAQVLRCPYHAWSYGLDGGLIGQPEFEGVAGWDRAGVCLPQFRAETWGPFVFVNLGPAAPALAEVLGRIPEETAAIGCPIGRLRWSYRRDYVIACNWKVYIDNYLEGYHLPAAHPGLFRLLDYSRYRVETFRHYSAQIAPLRNGASGEALYYWLFPNFMLNIYPGNLSSNLILPLGPDKTLTIFEWFAYEGEVPQSTIDFSDEIQQEDIRICESVQRGLASEHYNQGRYSVARENGVHHFHGLLAEYLIPPTEPRP
jgi:choline monooxygenase